MAANIKTMDLNLLRVFEAIHTHESLTKAGEHLGITQPAVSHALARLRELYDDPLFTRTSSGMRPTPVAGEIAADVRTALQRVRASLVKSTEFVASESDRHFRLAMGDLAESVLVPGLMKSLETDAPRVSLEMLADPGESTVRHLSSGKLDFAVSDILLGPDVMHSNIFKDEFVCAVRKRHPKIRHTVGLDDYLAQGHIRLSSTAGVNYVDSALSGIGHRRRVVLQTHHHLEAPYVALDTDLVLTTTRILAERHNLRVLELPFEVAPLSLCLYWHASAEADPACRWMRHRLLEVGKRVLNEAAEKRKAASRKVSARKTRADG